MARTKATVKRQNFGLVRKTLLLSTDSFSRRVARARANGYKCQQCNGDMKAFTKIRETNTRFNGLVCPPCARDADMKDGNMRTQLGPHGYALIVPDTPGKSFQIVRRSDPRYWEHVGTIAAKTLLHSREAHIGTAVRYECEVREEEAGSVINNRAERIAMNMGVFDLHADDPLKGTVIFSGPSYLPLTRGECEQFIAWAK